MYNENKDPESRKRGKKRRESETSVHKGNEEEAYIVAARPPN